MLCVQFAKLSLLDGMRMHHILQASAPLPLDSRMGEFDMVS